MTITIKQNGVAWTSLEAWKAQKELPEKHAQVLQMIKLSMPEGMMTWEISEKAPMHYTTVSAIVTGLQGKKPGEVPLIKDSGKWGLTPRNAKAIKWVTV